MNSNSKNRNILTHENTKNIRNGRLNNRDFIWKILTVIVLMEIILITPVVSSFLNTVIIRSTGQIYTTKVWSKSGSAEDIQAAVDAVAAAGGGIVYVPAGNFSFNPRRHIGEDGIYGVLIPGGVSVIGAGKDKTILTATTYPADTMFACDGSNDKPIRISGITFKGYVHGSDDSDTNNFVGEGVDMWNCKNFRVDHCRFIDFPNAGVGCGVYTVAVRLENGIYQYYWNWGVIDHCDFDNPYKLKPGSWSWAYGVAVYGPGRPDAWLYNADDIMGKLPDSPPNCALYQWNTSRGQYDLVSPYGGKQFRWLVYVEDCTFSRCRHAIASNNEAWYVARYNTITEPELPTIDIHGALGVDWWGGRGAEVYNNVIYGDGTTRAIDYRGGSGVVFGNTIYNCSAAVNLSYDQYQEVCLVNNLWVWDNTLINTAELIHHWYTPSPYQEERDYFLRAKPGYTPYTYPHPLTQTT